MRTIHVEFIVRVPDDITFEQAEEWVKAHLVTCWGMSTDNPLRDEALRVEPENLFID